MRVAELWRYPVKSLQGERLDRAAIATDGLVGDRRFAIFDVATGLGLKARRVPELLFASACWRDDRGVEITLPDGTIARNDEDMSTWLGRRVELRAADGEFARTYEVPLDIETEAEESWVQWNGPRGAFHDSTRTRVSLISTGTVGAWDARRFRANVIVDGDGEDALIGSHVRCGSAELDVTKAIDRCVMVTRPQPGGIARDLDVLRTIDANRGGQLAIGALVLREGEVAVGDSVTPI